MVEKLDMQSPNWANLNAAFIAEHFPNCITESANGKAIDFDLLRQELSSDIIEGNKERYRLEWPGKREAIVTANLPTTKTLRPIRVDSVDFDNTENIYIEGDNLEVLKILQESYFAKIKMIYIDPPYNTGNDFVYIDDFKKDARKSNLESGLVDEAGQHLTGLKDNPATANRYHSDWLSMIYPRLKLARNLLSRDGVLFISIDDNELANLIKLTSEIFGEDNFVSQLVWEKKKKGAFLSGSVTNIKEYILVFAKDIQKFNGLVGQIARSVETYPVIKTTNARGQRNIKMGIESKFRERDHFLKAGSRISSGNMELILLSDLVIKNGILHKDLKVESNWIYSQELLDKFADDGDLYITQDLYFRRVVSEPRTKMLKDLLSMKGDDQSGFDFVYSDNLFEDGWGTNEDGFDELHNLMQAQSLMSFPKPSKLIAKLILAACRFDPDCIILDFFSGSATTANATMKLNSLDMGKRRFIQVQLPEPTHEKSEAHQAGYKNICELGKERIRRAGIKIKEEIKTSIAVANNELEVLKSKLEAENTQSVINQDKIDEFTASIQLIKLNILQKTTSLGQLDIGFKVFKISESNMEEVYYRPHDYKQEALDLFADNVKFDRTADDLLTQVMLDWGLPLSLKIEQITIAGKQVFKVAETSLYACFDKGIDEDFAKAIAIDAPLRVLFRDNGFKNDTAKTNVKQLLKQLSPETEMKVI